MISVGNKSSQANWHVNTRFWGRGSFDSKPDVNTLCSVLETIGHLKQCLVDIPYEQVAPPI